MSLCHSLKTVPDSFTWIWLKTQFAKIHLQGCLQHRSGVRIGNFILILGIVVGNDITFQLCYHQVPHMHFQWYSWWMCTLQCDKHGFRGAHYVSNCFSLSVLGEKSLCVLCLLRFGYVYTISILRNQPLVIEHMVSMATTSKTSIKCKLNSIQEKMETISTVDST
jgi:hypothetical protein